MTAAAILFIEMKKTAKIKCKKRYRFKKATLYEREVIEKQKFFIHSEIFDYFQLGHPYYLNASIPTPFRRQITEFPVLSPINRMTSHPVR
jgi:hypothetical protein